MTTFIQNQKATRLATIFFIVCVIVFLAGAAAIVVFHNVDTLL